MPYNPDKLTDDQDIAQSEPPSPFMARPNCWRCYGRTSPAQYAESAEADRVPAWYCEACDTLFDDTIEVMHLNWAEVAFTVDDAYPRLEHLGVMPGHPVLSQPRRPASSFSEGPARDLLEAEDYQFTRSSLSSTPDYFIQADTAPTNYVIWADVEHSFTAEDVGVQGEAADASA